MLRALLIIGSVFAVTACGFEPLYATSSSRSSIPAELSRVRVAPLSDRTGQALQTALQRRLNPGGQNNAGDSGTDYVLKISLQDDMQFIGIREDAAPTRQRLQLSADYQLINAQTEAVVFAGQAIADNSIDIVDSEYATFVAEESARTRNADIIAERILSRLALYFRARAQSAP